MGFKRDIEIAQECEMLPITEIAEKANCGYETTEDFVYCPKCGNRF